MDRESQKPQNGDEFRGKLCNGTIFLYRDGKEICRVAREKRPIRQVEDFLAYVKNIAEKFGFILLSTEDQWIVQVSHPEEI